MTTEPRIQRDEIVRAALDVLDDHGFDALSMRAVADALDIKAASLYWHVKNKRELLDLMTDALIGECALPDPDLPWDEQLTAFGRELRRVMLSRRDASRVFDGRFVTGDTTVRAMESTVATLLGAGFTAKTASYALFTLLFHVVGFTRLEATMYVPGRRDELASTGEHLAALPAEEFPAVRSIAGELVAPGLPDRFEFGLRMLINGLRTERTAAPD